MHHIMESWPHAWLVEASELTGPFTVAGAPKRQRQEVRRKGETQNMYKKRCTVVLQLLVPVQRDQTPTLTLTFPFISLHLCPDIVRAVFLCIVVLADNSLTIELVSHYCTFGLSAFFIPSPLSSTSLCSKPKIHPKHLLKQVTFLLVLSLTASSCGGEEKKQGLRYIYMPSMCV